MEEYKISKEFLDNFIKQKAIATVGRILKRIDIFEEKKNLKKSVKELIYEEFRDIRDTIEAFSKGQLFSLRQKHTRHTS